MHQLRRSQQESRAKRRSRWISARQEVHKKRLWLPSARVTTRRNQRTHHLAPNEASTTHRCKLESTQLCACSDCWESRSTDSLARRHRRDCTLSPQTLRAIRPSKLGSEEELAHNCQW